MQTHKEFSGADGDCGTLLVFAPHHATERFLRYVKKRKASLDWTVVDRWSASGRGFLVVHVDAGGENMFELVADDAKELMTKTLDLAARMADDVTRTQAGGIGSHSTLEAVNTKWVALGGISNPQFDRTICIH